jgi:hypothetical protein
MAPPWKESFQHRQGGTLESAHPQHSFSCYRSRAGAAPGDDGRPSRSDLRALAPVWMSAHSAPPQTRYLRLASMTLVGIAPTRWPNIMLFWESLRLSHASMSTVVCHAHRTRTRCAPGHSPLQLRWRTEAPGAGASLRGASTRTHTSLPARAASPRAARLLASRRRRPGGGRRAAGPTASTATRCAPRCAHPLPPSADLLRLAAER